LSDRLGYDPSAIVSLVDDLQRLELAERRPDPNDRRNRIVVLTEAGRRLLRESEQDGARVTDELLAPLGAQERRTLHDLLLRIAEPSDAAGPAAPAERSRPAARSGSAAPAADGR
jgi:DNA-binding MarR family transcriptional regulator